LFNILPVIPSSIFPFIGSRLFFGVKTVSSVASKIIYETKSLPMAYSSYCKCTTVGDTKDIPKFKQGLFFSFRFGCTVMGRVVSIDRKGMKDQEQNHAR
jgi:hypothetical protein